MRHLEFEQESADGRAIGSSQLLLKPPGARFNAGPILHCLRCLHEVNKGIVEALVGTHLAVVGGATMEVDATRELDVSLVGALSLCLTTFLGLSVCRASGYQ